MTYQQALDKVRELRQRYPDVPVSDEQWATSIMRHEGAS